MTASRTSNKQILDAILALTEAITATNTKNAAPASEPPVLTEKAEPATTQADNLTLNKNEQRYLAVMNGKFEAYAEKIGEPIVGYAYRKSNGKLGFWSVPQSQWADKKAKIKNLIGPLAVHGA